MTFKDHFSSQASGYSRYRPGYPAELIGFVASRAPDQRLAVDCATGSGQAALAIAEYFDCVLAVDASLDQLARSQPHPRVLYAASLAEQLPIGPRSVALVTAAQAVHWFDFSRFYDECRRVLVPGGVIAVWTYEKFRLDPAVDAVVDRFYSQVVGPDWPAERRYVELGYRTLPFPWNEESPPDFAHETDWDLAEVLGYLGTWSAVQRYRDRVGSDPLPALKPELAAAWGDERTRTLRWPIHLRLGRG